MREIKLTQGKVALIDDDDYERISQFKWCASRDSKTFYACRAIKRGDKWTTVPMHRIILDAPIGMEVDHIDHNGLNNQKSNLRIVTRGQNQFNKTPCGKSKYLGVSLYTVKGRTYIKAYITHNRKRMELGHFYTEEAAAAAYNEAAIRLFGEFAHLNVIENLTDEDRDRIRVGARLKRNKELKEQERRGQREKKHKVGDYVRIRIGNAWLYGQIDKVYDDGYYEVSYGTKKRFDKLADGWSFDFFGSAHQADLRPINYWKENVR